MIPGKKKQNSTFINIIWIGFLVGTFDADAAIIWAYKTNPVVIFQYIASGVFGKAAFANGSGMALWGVLFHYIIAYSFTAVFYLLYPGFAAVLKNKYLVALVFGIITWVITNLVIVPLSRIGWHAMHINGILIGAGILVFSVGLPVALMADKHYRGKRR